MSSYKAKGVVLHTIKYGDSGLVVYMYADVWGRQTYIIQGVHSKKGNKAALFQPMFLLDYEGYEPRYGDMHRMKDISASTPLTSLPFDARKSTISLFMAEVIYRLIREQEPNQNLFDFICESVKALDNIDSGVSNFHLWFLVKLTYFLGFYPGNTYRDGDCFDIIKGEFVHHTPSHRMYISGDDSSLLGKLMACRVNDLGGIALSRNSRVSFLNSLLIFISYHSDSINSVRSIEILREVF